LPAAAWQNCYLHSLRNALDYLPRKADDDYLTEVRGLYDRRDWEEARTDLAKWLEHWQGYYAKLCVWVEANIKETSGFFRFPREHHKHLKSTNLLERLNKELTRRTPVIRIFPNEASCLGADARAGGRTT
jgi:transposase-like protein